MGAFITVSGGNQPIHLGHGHDTIAIFGYGSETIGHGSAAVFGGPHWPFEFFGPTMGSASISGSNLEISASSSGLGETALGGHATLQGGFGPDTLVGGPGQNTLIGGLGPDTLTGGGTGSSNLFAFESPFSGHHLITNFTSGSDQLYVDGTNLSYLQGHHDISISGGNTYIHLGGTTIELEGVTTPLVSTDITTHKP